MIGEAEEMGVIVDAAADATCRERWVSQVQGAYGVLSRFVCAKAGRTAIHCMVRTLQCSNPD